MSQPLIVIGAPRSGTTFLYNVLNEHPDIGLTNESRVFAELMHRLEVAGKRDDLVGKNIQPAWADFQRRHAGEWIEQFYREALNIRTPIWGDKHPPYADITLLTGREGAAAIQPQSGSCLALIAEILPRAKFIHIHRHPARVAQSLFAKRWIGSITEGLEIWRQYLTEISAFFATLPAARKLTLAHRALTGAPERSAAEIAAFLELPDPRSLSQFLRSQHRRPTPFSDPVSDLRAPGRAVSEQDERNAERALGELAERFGYGGAAAGAAAREADEARMA